MRLHCRSRCALIPLAAALALVANGCATKTHYVVAATGTVIGVEIDQDPATQTPQAKLGYNRGELAIVPTDRQICSIPEDKKEVVCAPAGGTAESVPDVLMELKYAGIFDTGQASGIYQRLAVGNTAVQQPGAAAMFLRNSSGNVDENMFAALAAVQNVPETTMTSIERKNRMLGVYKANAAQKDSFDAAAKSAGFDSFIEFVVDGTTEEQEVKVEEQLRASGIVLP